MSSPTPFVDRVLAGEVIDLAEIDDDIEAWHAGSSGVPLHTYLGMSWDEYALFVEGPDSRAALVVQESQRG